MQDKAANLISGHLLTRNVFWNLIGAGAPLVVAIFTIPILIDGLGMARFGVLTLTWMIVGYFSLFDLGLGRALTKLVAEKIGKDLGDDVPKLIWTALSLMLLLGAVGGGVVAGLSPWLVSDVLNIPPDLQAETLASFYLLSVSVPLVISSAGLQGVLEAHQRFGLVNVVRIPLGVFTFLGPVLVLSYSHDLVYVVAVLVIIRLLSWLAFTAFCLHIEPGLLRSAAVDRDMFGPLINFGGWMTVTNIISPLMVNLDRFMIGATLSMTAVSYYATPYEVVTRLLIVPVALMGVMFPAFTTVLAHDRDRIALLYIRTVKYIFVLLFPAVLSIVMFAGEGLALWIDSEFAANSSLVLQLLAAGVFINAHANVPFGLVQSAGRPDLTAKLHIIELPFYLVLLWWLLNSFGIVGVAIAWFVRVVFDATVLFVMAGRLVDRVSGHATRVFLTAGIALACMAIGLLDSSLGFRLSITVFILSVFAAIAWIYILCDDERDRVRQYLRL